MDQEKLIEIQQGIIVVLLKRLWEFTDETQMIEPDELLQSKNKYELRIEFPHGERQELVVSALPTVIALEDG